ncbi:MAG: ABC transporter permease, partial [Acidobacteriota bacterium]|nr:ABC transporter permease [Acidobacteriota bacterium]
MTLRDILHLSLRNLREAKLRATLTTMGVIVGVAVIVTMVSFGLGLQRNTVARFKELDLFNEITVFGKNISNLMEAEMDRRQRGPGDPERNRPVAQEKTHERPLDDAAITEIANIRGVASVEPNISFNVYVRINGKARTAFVGGTLVPNPSSRFKNFSAGGMISSPDAGEAVVDEAFLKNFGIEKPADAVGQKLELLAPPERKKKGEEEDETPNFFGVPLEADEGGGERAASDALVARTFRIAGVLGGELSGVGRRFRGIMPAYNIYIPVKAARQWTEEHRSEQSEVALELARESGMIARD